MSRARYDQDTWQTAAAYESQGSGCLSGFFIPPLVVLLVGFLLAFLASTTPTPSAPLPMQTAAPGSSRLSPVFTPEVQYWDASISRWAAATGLDPNLVAVIMQIESCGNPFARSSAGAAGLFQVMPYHFLAADNPTAPDTNAARGLDYLKRSLAASKNDVRLALAGYNGGIGVISRSEWTWPAETVRYAYWGSGIYADAVSGAAASPRLAEWLKAGGASLCTQARQKLGINN
jgi:soluble lytic murein transglycosylase-like protein